jgi:uncharacterized protein involved in type VI secretion and phage assembly
MRMSPFELPVADSRVSFGLGGRFYGVYAAVVVDISDPDAQGRVRVKLPWSPDSNDENYEAWARLAVLMAGQERGSWFIPDVDDEVAVLFEAGDPRRPFVIGGLWNGRDAPPESMDSGGRNDKKSITSRNGVKITLDDASGSERLTLETPGGQKLELRDGPGEVEISDANGNVIKCESSGVTVTSSAKVTVQASTVEVSAGMVTVNAGMSKFSGVVQADTVIANAVVSSSYTPGAGNIW